MTERSDRPADLDWSRDRDRDDRTTRRRTQQLVHARLRQAILGGEVEPGAPISQLALSQQLGVSRGPLREALRMLEHEGLVESEPNRRMRVTGFSMPDLEELYAMRIALETLAVSLGVSAMDGAHLEALEAQVIEIEAAAERGDHEEWIGPHREFHRLLVSPAGPRVTGAAEELSDHAERYRQFYAAKAPGAWLEGVPDHRAIFEAVRDRDPGAAASRLARHYSAVVLALIARLDPERDPVAIRLAVRMAAAYRDLGPEAPERGGKGEALTAARVSGDA